MSSSRSRTNQRASRSNAPFEIVGDVSIEDDDTERRTVQNLGGNGVCIGVNIHEFARKVHGFEQGGQVLVKSCEKGVYICPVSGGDDE